MREQLSVSGGMVKFDINYIVFTSECNHNSTESLSNLFDCYCHVTTHGGCWCVALRYVVTRWIICFSPNNHVLRTSLLQKKMYLGYQYKRKD